MMSFACHGTKKSGKNNNCSKRGTPLGAGGSRLLGGHHRQHQEVEEFLAQTFRREAALIYGSGYLANIGVITALFKDAHIFSDNLITPV